jgi:serine/threonine-protein kinase
MSSAVKNPRPVGAGTHFGKYELLDCIAESLMSKVFLGRLSLGKLNRIVVIKTLHPSYLSNKDSREQFYRETQMTMALAHPNIIQIYEFGEEDGCPFIVMEWVHGRDLKDVVRTKLDGSGRGISPLIACYLIEQAAKALEYAHDFKDKLTGQSYNLVHRDLSPHNLILGFNGAIKLIDFGVARVAHGMSDSLSDQIWGKAGYFSPEQANGHRLDRRSDIFALGAVLFELLSGRRLFPGKDLMASMGRIFQADTHVPEMLSRLKGLPQPLADIIIKSTRTKREDRYESAAKFAEDVRKYVRSQSTTVDSEAVVRFMAKVFPGEAEKDEARLRELMAGLAPTTPVSAPKDFKPRLVTEPADGTSEPPTDELAELDNNETPAPMKDPAQAPAAAAPAKVVEPPPPVYESGWIPPADAGPQPGAPAAPPPPASAPAPLPTVASLIPKGLKFNDEPARPKKQQRRKERAEPSVEPDTGNSLKLAGLRRGLFVVKFAALIAGGIFVYYFWKGIPVPVTHTLPGQGQGQGKPAQVRVRLHLTPEYNWSTNLWLDGKAVSPDAIVMEANRPHRLEIQRPGFQRLIRDVGAAESEDIELVPLRVGTLVLNTSPSATGKVTNGTDLWVKRGGRMQFLLPPGSYRVYLSTPDGRERIVVVTITQNVITVTSAPL